MANHPNPRFALREFLGMELAAESDGVVARVEIGPAHMNPNQVVHGAVIFALIDTAMGGATMTALDDGLNCATVDIDVRFIRPASAGHLHAVARVVKAGRSIVHLDARVTGDEDRLIATAVGTFAVVG